MLFQYIEILLIIRLVCKIWNNTTNFNYLNGYIDNKWKKQKIIHHTEKWYTSIKAKHYITIYWNFTNGTKCCLNKTFQRCLWITLIFSNKLLSVGLFFIKPCILCWTHNCSTDNFTNIWNILCLSHWWKYPKLSKMINGMKSISLKRESNTLCFRLWSN